jgi:hypothetical protein
LERQEKGRKTDMKAEIGNFDISNDGRLLGIFTVSCALFVLKG